MEQRLGQLDKTIASYRERVDKMNIFIVEIELVCERTSKHIEQYEQENNAIDADVNQLVSRESDQQVEVDELNQKLK